MPNLVQFPTRDLFIPKDPPPELIKSLAWQVSMLAVMGLLAATVFIIAMRRWRTTGRSDMFWITLGAMCAVFYEPLGDSMVDIVYHQSGALTVLTGFGITIPLWTLFTYAVFWGPALLWLTNLLETGVTAKRWMGLFAASIPCTWLFEVPLLAMGSFTYYGSQQPIKILDYPVWMAFSNTAVIFVVALLIHAAKKTALVREHPAVFVLLVPSFTIGVGVTTLLPIAFGMSSTTSLLIINLCAAASALLSIAYAWVSFSMIAPPAQAHRPADADAEAVAA